MPFLLALVGIIVAAYVWASRARNAANVATDLADMANDVRLAARRFGFKRRTDIHPAESIEDPNLAIAGIAIAFVELDDFPTQEHRAALNVHLRAQTRVDQETADEMVILGRWLVTECGGASPAISRLSRKLFRLKGAPAFDPLLTIIQNTLDGQSGLNQRQKEALHEVKNAFHVR
jgi:hypothetical protein